MSRSIFASGRPSLTAFRFERVAVREDIEHGQRVIAGAWRRIATGYQRVLPLPGPVTASRVHIRIQSSRAKPRLGRTTLHRATD
ncbi:hypothetical protein [Streptomyces sp. NPDC056796]|uniref:hypothetical protein n=1 Tax=Streptomyces sp. NPDC056796 TaxID=3345947 RepID=UPI0036A2C4CE